VQSDVFINLRDYSFEYRCICGQDLSGSLGNNITTGVRILYRSSYEYTTTSDYSLCVVLAAMAFECDLSRLYFKWKRIDALHDDVWPSDQELEVQLRSFYTIDDKIENVASLMYADGLIPFIKSQNELSSMILDGFPSLSIDDFAKSIQRNLFWPRNSILHLGKQATQDQAKKCFNTSTLAIRIFETLDQHRIATA
jgi:hypothetical protein